MTERDPGCEKGSLQPPNHTHSLVGITGPYDIHIFGHLEKPLKRFATDTNLRQAVTF